MSFYSIPLTAPLIAWYAQNARALPWRETGDPYAIWVSEIMLQQTRVEAVKPYYARFLQRLPTISHLACCPEDELMKLWEGLGYYSRARNMRRAAQLLLERYEGCFPRSVEELLLLPGVGPYTAGAIASIAFGVPAPAVDGNVLRVLARLCNSDTDIAAPRARRQAERAITEMIPRDAPGIFNQALMELGATVCLPNAAPLCGRCPLAPLCAGRAAGRAADLPVKAKKAPRRVEQHTVFFLTRQRALAIQGEPSPRLLAVRRRPPGGLLGGLWELPNLPGKLTKGEMADALTQWGIRPAGEISRYAAKHIFTHVEWRMQVYAMETAGIALPPGWEWAEEDGAHALPTAFRVCMR